MCGVYFIAIISTWLCIEFILPDTYMYGPSLVYSLLLMPLAVLFIQEFPRGDCYCQSIEYRSVLVMAVMCLVISF